MAKITGVELFPLRANFKKPFSFSGIVRTSSKNVLIRIQTDEGVAGIGESCPVPGMSGETDVSIRHAIEAYIAPILIGADPLEIASLTARIDRAINGNIVAKAGINIALYDLAGRLLNVPVYTLLGGKYRDEVEINGSVGLGTAEEMIATCEEQIADAGVRFLKLYCGRDDVDADVAKLRRVIEAVGGRARVFLDVNQQWSVKEAVRALTKLEEQNLLFVEQPTPKWDMAGMRYVRESVKVPIAADEAVFSLTDITLLGVERAVDIVTIYAMKPGGIRKGQDAVTLSTAFGLDCFIGSYLELGVATAAGVHLASAIPGLKYPCYMFGPLKYEFDVLQEDLDIRDGKVGVPSGPGLGVDLDMEKVRKLLA